MFFNHVVELFSLSWIGLFVLIPAAVVNRRVDQAKQKLIPDEVRRRTALEIDELYAWYSSQISREDALSIGAAYARYSTQYQESIIDQFRKIFEHAIKLRIFVPREYVFFDTGVTGKKRRRIGFSALEDALRGKRVQTALFFATNRLFRKMYRTIEFVDRVHTSWGVRCIFVASHVDTEDKEQWKLLLGMRSMVDEFVITMYANHIRAAHEGAFEKRHVFGTISYGYLGEIIENEFTAKGKPRRRLKVDPVTACIVRWIFHLFVIERLGLNEIVRMLNDDATIPLPTGCRSKLWTDDTVRRILKNTRYRGLWRYGVTESVFLPEQDYVRQIRRLEPLKEAQIEELRIVDDELWCAAAKLLAEHNGVGRPPKDGNRMSRPKILNGLHFCAKHERPLTVFGAYGTHMACPVCMCLPFAKRLLTSWLNRRVALRLICEELSRHIDADDKLIDQIIDACRCEAEVDQRKPRGNPEALKAKRDKFQRRIDFAFKAVGDTDEDRTSTLRVIGELRREKLQTEVEMARLAAARKKKVKIPTRAEVRALLNDLTALLVEGSQSDDPAERALVRRLIEELTGGRIVMSQQGERKRQKGWLRGTFRLRLLSTVLDRVSDGAVVCDEEGVEVSIDFKRPLKTDAKAEIAWKMNQNNNRHPEIAKELGCVSSYVTKLLKYYAEKNGLEWVDGRSTPSNFPNRYRTPGIFEKICHEAAALYAKDELLIEELAKYFDVHVATVRKAIRWSYELRGLTVPNGRTRAGRIKEKRNQHEGSS